MNEVVPATEFRTRVRVVARRFAEMPTKAVEYTKRVLNESMYLDLERSLELEAEMQHIAGGTEDHLEGVRAIIEKRKPSFSGR